MRLTCSASAKQHETFPRHERLARRLRLGHGCVTRLAPLNGWDLVSIPYALIEVQNNLAVFPTSASTAWTQLRQGLIVMRDVFSLDRPSVFSAAKDRPILFSAVACADVLLTLDRGDFGSLRGRSFYGLDVLKPGDFLQRERAAGRLLPLQ